MIRSLKRSDKIRLKREKLTKSINCVVPEVGLQQEFSCDGRVYVYTVNSSIIHTPLGKGPGYGFLESMR